MMFHFDGDYVMLGYHLGYHIDRMSGVGYSINSGVNTIYVPIMKGNMSDQSRDELMDVLVENFGEEQANVEWDAVSGKALFIVNDLGNNDYEVTFDVYAFKPSGMFAKPVYVNEYDLDLVQEWTNYVRDEIMSNMLNITVY